MLFHCSSLKMILLSDKLIYFKTWFLRMSPERKLSPFRSQLSKLSFFYWFYSQIIHFYISRLHSVTESLGQPSQELSVFAFTSNSYKYSANKNLSTLNIFSVSAPFSSVLCPVKGTRTLTTIMEKRPINALNFFLHSGLRLDPNIKLLSWWMLSSLVLLGSLWIN